MAANSMTAAEEIAKYHLDPNVFIALPATFIALCTVALSLRIYVRAVMLKTLGLDDYLLFLAYAIFVGDCSLFIAMGRIELQEGLTGPLETLSEYQLIGMLIYVINQIILKLSVALFFLRIVQAKYQRILIISSISIYSAYEVALVFVALFQCGAPGATAILTGPSCLPWDTIFGPINYIGGALNAIVDWIFVLTPIITIWKTSMMARRALVSVCVLIGLGAVGSVASVARIPILGELGIQNSLDYFSGITPLTLVSLTETGVGIICVSLATLRPLLDRLMGSIASTISSHRGTTLRETGGGGGSHLRSLRRNLDFQPAKASPHTQSSFTTSDYAMLPLVHSAEPAGLSMGQGMGFEMEKGSETRIWTEPAEV